MEPKAKKQRTLGSMFNFKPTPKRRFRGVELPLQWYSRESVLIKRPVNCNYTSTKVASFDFDSCLVMDATHTWNSNRPIPIRPGVISKLRQLHKDKYRLVIFTNEKTIGNRTKLGPIENAIAKKTSRLDEFVRWLECPMEIFVATADDQTHSITPKVLLRLV